MIYEHIFVLVLYSILFLCIVILSFDLLKRKTFFVANIQAQKPCLTIACTNASNLKYCSLTPLFVMLTPTHLPCSYPFIITPPSLSFQWADFYYAIETFWFHFGIWLLPSCWICGSIYDVLFFCKNITRLLIPLSTFIIYEHIFVFALL